MNIEQKNEITARFKDMENGSDAFYTVHPDTPNKEMWLKIVLDGNYETADALIQAIEAKDSELSTNRIWDKYYAERNAEYRKRGVTRDAIMEAQWEKDMEGRPEKADALQIIRLEVKALIPKPE